MFGKKTAEIADLKLRIAILEERLCPFGQHDGEVIDSERVEYTPGYGRTTYTCKCKRCGKMGAQWEED